MQIFNNYRQTFNRRVDLSYSNYIDNSLSNLFNGCINYDQTTVIPKQITNISSIFENCHNLVWGNVILRDNGNNITDMSKAFFNTRWRMSINIPSSVTNLTSTFALTKGNGNSSDYFGTIDLTNARPTTLDGTFSGTKGKIVRFTNNYYSIIPNSVTSMIGTFESADIKIGNKFFIPNSVTNMYSAFSYTNFNANIYFDENAEVDLSYAFTGGCFNNFNCIPKNTTNLCYAFQNSRVDFGYGHVDISKLNKITSLYHTFENSDWVAYNTPINVNNFDYAYNNVSSGMQLTIQNKRPYSFRDTFNNSFLNWNGIWINSEAELTDFRYAFQDARSIPNIIHIRNGDFSETFANFLVPFNSYQTHNIKIIGNMTSINNAFYNRAMRKLDLCQANFNLYESDTLDFSMPKMVPASNLGLPVNFDNAEKISGDAFANWVRVCGNYSLSEAAAANNNWGARWWKTHSFGTSVLKNESNCTDEGYYSSTCTNCGGELFDFIQKTTHNYVNGVCVECGFTLDFNSVKNYYYTDYSFNNAIVGIDYNNWYIDFGSLITFPKQFNGKNTIVRAEQEDSYYGFKGLNINSFEKYRNLAFDFSNVSFYNNSAYQAFYYSGALNSSIIFPNYVENMANTFVGCYSFNGPIIMPKEGVTNMAGCFMSCWNFNQNITIPKSVINMANCFSYCNNFNQLISFPEDIEDITDCFSSCYNFNQNIKIPDISNLSGLFKQCNNLSYNITVGKNCENLSYTFYNCKNIQEINILSNNITNMEYAFFGCDNLVKLSDIIFEKPVEMNYALPNYSEVYINSWHFKNTVSNINFYMMENIQHLYFEKDFGWGSEVPYQRFYGCTNLKLALPNMINDCRTSSDFQGVKRVCTENTQFLNNASSYGNWGALSFGRHQWENTEKIEPTCTESGLQGRVCLECDYSDAQILPALGHNYNRTGTCLRCGETNLRDAYDNFKAIYDETIIYSINELKIITRDSLITTLYPDFDENKDALTQVTNVYDAKEELITTIKSSLENSIGFDDISDEEVIG